MRLMWLLLVALPLLAGDDVAGVRALLKEDRAQEALHMARRLLAAAGSDAALLAAAGDAQFRMGLFAAAKVSYSQALSADANSARALFGLARVSVSEKNHRTADALMQRAYAADSGDPEIIREWAGMQEDFMDEIAALEMYLLRGTNEEPEKLLDARNRIGFLRATGGRRTATLVAPPQEATLRLTLIEGGPRGEPRGFGIGISINGAKAQTLLFDTGASGITIPRKLATKLGVKSISISRLRGVGDGGPKPATMGIAESVRIGTLNFKDVPVTISDKESPGTSAGLLGSTLFSEFVVTLDGPQRQLHLDLSRALQREGEGAADATVPRGEEAFTKVRAFNHLLLVSTLAGGRKNGWFLIDSGASSNMISLALARVVGSYTAPGSVQLNGVSGRVDRPYLARGVALLFGGFHWPNQEMLAFEFQKLNKSVGTEISGLLGFPTLEKLVTTIDYPNGLVRFQKGKQ